jgi:hypothetical protein
MHLLPVASRRDVAGGRRGCGGGKHLEESGEEEEMVEAGGHGVRSSASIDGQGEEGLHESSEAWSEWRRSMAMGGLYWRSA